MEEFDRKVIPIWDSSIMAATLAENSSTRNTADPVVLGNETPRLIDELAHSQAIGAAVELLNAAKLERHREGMIIASKRILTEGDLPQPVLTMARIALAEESDEFQPQVSGRARIHDLRQRLRSNPRNTLAWVDMSREYLILGLGEPAARAMSIALGLAGGHRWVTRVASRLFVHLEDFDRSHALLSKHPAVKNDPWIASAELAVCQLLEKPSKNIVAAKRLLEQRFHPRHTSELASSLGTLEIESGAIKKAKTYIRASLLDPNRNSLAQAVWAEQAHDINFASHSAVQGLDIAYEAKAWENYIRGEIQPAIENCKAWYDSEPYSSQPPILAGYLAALDDRYDEIIATATRGLVTSPGNPTLKLNKAYGEMAKIDPINPAESDTRKVAGWVTLFQEHMKIDRYHAAHALANMGMLCYRLGVLDKGREYYEKAEKICAAERFNTQLMCVIYHAREAMLARASWAGELLEKARHASIKHADHGKEAAVAYLDKLNALQANPDNYLGIFKLERPIATLQTPSIDRVAFANSIQQGLTFYLPEDFKRF